MPQRTREERREYHREYGQTERGHEIVLAADARYRAKHNDRIQERHNLKNYGLSKDEYWQLWNSQGGKCLSCGADNSGIVNRNGSLRPMFVDHDHITGKVRGLLCSNCNAALGFVRDNPETLARLIDYLARR